MGSADVERESDVLQEIQVKVEIPVKYTFVARTWKQPRCPSADERMRKSWLLFSVAQSFLFVTPWTATC